MVEPLTTRVAIAFERTDADTRAQGAAWYPAARAEARAIARRTGASMAKSAGMVAALSPRKRWAENLKDAELALATGEIKHTRAMAKVAQRILDGTRPLDALNGPKVRSFYRNIMGDADAVTVDVWAARAAGATEQDLRRKDGYATVADAYRRAAALHGVPCRDLQATVWIDARGAAA